jgi:hypothetical protein
MKTVKVLTEWDKECIREKANQAAKFSRDLQKMATLIRGALKDEKKALVIDVTEINIRIVDVETGVHKLNNIMKKYGAEWTKN